MSNISTDEFATGCAETPPATRVSKSLSSSSSILSSVKHKKYCKIDLKYTDNPSSLRKRRYIAKQGK